jgi:hypothetical protein
MQPIIFALQRGRGLMRGKNTAGSAKGIGPRVAFRPLPTAAFKLTGITKDETGAASGGFTVYLFVMTADRFGFPIPVLADKTISDGGGNYSFNVNGVDRYWVADYKAGSPDKAGATLNTLTGVLS